MRGGRKSPILISRKFSGTGEIMNYQKELEKVIDRVKSSGRTPKLLLHSCCAPCSSYVLEYLSEFFEITVFYYNPNIYPESEHGKRSMEQRKLIREMRAAHRVSFLEGAYEREKFYRAVAGVEHLREGSERCFRCFELRLRETAQKARKDGYEYFTTTLSISPLKNAEKLNEIGVRLGEEYKVKYLQSDFKKRDGYKRSIELSRKFGLYRQNYCGCEFSYAEAERRSKKP